MRPVIWCVLLGASAVDCAVLWGQTAGQQSAGSPARPQAAAAAMKESIARQEASVRQQALQQGDDFFVLSGPERALRRFAGAASQSSCEALPMSTVDDLVADAARRESIDEKLLRRVMQQESEFRPCAVSSKGAMGLMQLMPATAQEFNVADPFDPAENIGAGARLLHELLVRYNGDVTLALAAYNAGPAAVEANHGVPPFAETTDYIRAILSLVPWNP